MTSVLRRSSKGGAGYEEAGRFAAAMCTIKLQATGPFRSSAEEVRQLFEKI